MSGCKAHKDLAKMQRPKKRHARLEAVAKANRRRAKRRKLEAKRFDWVIDVLDIVVNVVLWGIGLSIVGFIAWAIIQSGESPWIGG